MKLSKREQSLLGLLLIMVVIGGGYFGLIQPQMERYDKLKNERDALEVKYTEFVASLSPTHRIYNNFTIMDNKVKNVTSLFFPELKQQKFILILKDQIDKAGIDPTSIQFSKVESIKLEADTEKEKEKKEDKLGDAADAIHTNKLPGAGQSQAQATTSEATDVEKARAEQEKLLESLDLQMATLVFDGTYEQLKSFINAVEGYDKRITVEEVTSIKQEGKLQHTVLLGFYAMEKVHKDQDLNFMSWDLLGVYGKDNPYSGIDLSKLGGKQIVGTGTQKTDFFMALSPIVSDMTTVMLSQDGDRTRSSFVYADNNAMEPVTMEFIEKGGKYFYRYKTGSEKYPINYEEYVAFTPKSNNISVFVASKPRTGADDKSGVNLTVINKTNLKVSIKVENDDTKSRLLLVKKQGDVSVFK